MHQRNPPRLKSKKLNNQSQDDMCLYGRTSHSYGDWTEVYREKKRIVCKVCKVCTHLMYKDEYLKIIEAEKSKAYEIRNQHIDLFKP